jgi:hypothetical protein
MRKFLLIMCLSAVLISCSKNDPPPPQEGSLLLKEIITSSAGSPDQINYLTFDYDAQGRLIRMKLRVGNSAEAPLHQISYPDASTVLIRDGVTSPTSGEEVSFKLDGSGRPLVRYAREFLNVDPPGNFQRSVEADTTYYFYGSGGLLERTITRHVDSTNAPGTASGIQRRNYTDTVIFNNVNGNLVSTLGQWRDTMVQFSPGPVTTRITRYRKQTDFDYTSQWLLGNYGPNAFLYAELDAIGGMGQPLFLPYQNFRNKFIERLETLNASGTVIGTFNTVYDFTPISIRFNQLNLLEQTVYRDPGTSIDVTRTYRY